MAVTRDQTVGEIVAERLGRAQVFQRFQIDFCCGGKQSLAKACQSQGVDLEIVLRELAASDEQDQAPPQSLEGLGIPGLVQHLTETHHAYLRNDLPRLEQLAQKVAGVHGDRHPELSELHSVVRRFSKEMLMHLDKEEMMLFQLCLELASAGGDLAQAANFLPHPIAQMEIEHEDAGRDLQAMRRLTNGFVVPEDACTSYRVLFDGLSRLEADTHLHIHKENNVLFRLALAKANELKGAAVG